VASAFSRSPPNGHVGPFLMLLISAFAELIMCSRRLEGRTSSNASCVDQGEARRLGSHRRIRRGRPWQVAYTDPASPAAFGSALRSGGRSGGPSADGARSSTGALGPAEPDVCATQFAELPVRGIVPPPSPSWRLRCAARQPRLSRSVSSASFARIGVGPRYGDVAWPRVRARSRTRGVLPRAPGRCQRLGACRDPRDRALPSPSTRGLAASSDR
jgi:hypothetical protein